MRRTFETFVALRYLRSKRKEVFISIITVISILGVAVSVMVLDIVLAVMTGFERELQAKFLDTSAHVVVRKYGGNMNDWERVAEQIRKIPGVTEVSPYTYNQALLSVPGAAHGLLIRGIVASEANKQKLAKSLSDPAGFDKLFQPGRLAVERPDGSEDQVELPPLLIGQALANRFNIPVGTPVTILSPQFTSSPQGLIPKLRRFIVTGEYSSGLVEYESGLAYTSLEAAQRFFGMGQGVTALEVQTRDLNEALVIAEKIRAELQELPFEVTDWTVPNKPLFDALRLEKQVYFIVLLLLILIASFSIVSTLVMIVMEKGKDIAILKAMGASDSRILRIFLLQGALIGAGGTIIGTGLGCLGCIALREYGFPIDQAVFSLSTVPVHIVPVNFVLVAISGFVITSLAGVYPARRAARLQPADALRYE